MFCKYLSSIFEKWIKGGVRKIKLIGTRFKIWRMTRYNGWIHNANSHWDNVVKMKMVNCVSIIKTISLKTQNDLKYWSSQFLHVYSIHLHDIRDKANCYHVVVSWKHECQSWVLFDHIASCPLQGENKNKIMCTLRPRYPFRSHVRSSK